MSGSRFFSPKKRPEQSPVPVGWWWGGYQPPTTPVQGFRSVSYSYETARTITPLRKIVTNTSESAQSNCSIGCDFSSIPKCSIEPASVVPVTDSLTDPVRGANNCNTLLGHYTFGHFHRHARSLPVQNNSPVTCQAGHQMSASYQVLFSGSHSTRPARCTF